MRDECFFCGNDVGLVDGEAGGFAGAACFEGGAEVERVVGAFGVQAGSDGTVLVFVEDGDDVCFWRRREQFLDDVVERVFVRTGRNKVLFGEQRPCQVRVVVVEVVDA